MKKAIVVLSIAAMALTATTAFAKGPDHGLHLGGLFNLGHGGDVNLPASQFVLFGSIHGTPGSSSLSVDVIGSVHVPTLSGGLAVVAVNSSTKIEKDKDHAATLADLAVDDNVVIQG